MVPAVGNPDLSPRDGGEPRRGLVIFPARTSLSTRPPLAAGAATAWRSRAATWLGEWRIVIAALVLAALVVALALLLR